MLKRYLLFTGCNYYPSGGWEDFHSTSESREELEATGIYACGAGADWAQIVDTETLGFARYNLFNKVWA